MAIATTSALPRPTPSRTLNTIAQWRMNSRVGTAWPSPYAHCILRPRRPDWGRFPCPKSSTIWPPRVARSARPERINRNEGAKLGRIPGLFHIRDIPARPPAFRSRPDRRRVNPWPFRFDFESETDMSSTEPRTAPKVRHSRRIEHRVRGVVTSDGAGVKLTRLLSQPLQRRLDPFLMMDAFGSDDPDDYIAGFPDHPH